MAGGTGSSRRANAGGHRPSVQLHLRAEKHGLEYRLHLLFVFLGLGGFPCNGRPVCFGGPEHRSAAGWIWPRCLQCAGTRSKPLMGFDSSNKEVALHTLSSSQTMFNLESISSR